MIVPSVARIRDCEPIEKSYFSKSKANMRPYRVFPATHRSTNIKPSNVRKTSF